MRRNSAFHFGFSGREGLAQFGQRVAAEHRSQKEAVRFERAADLDEGAGQIVDELQCEGRDDQIQRSVAERQRLFVRDDVGVR